MFNFKRVLLFAMAFVLLPLGPARSEPADVINWSGTIVIEVRNSSYYTQPSGFDWTNRYFLIETLTRKYTALGNGYATEKVEYSYWNHWNRNCFDQDTGYYQGEAWQEVEPIQYVSPVPLPFSLQVVSDDHAVVLFNQVTIPYVAKFTLGCGDTVHETGVSYLHGSPSFNLIPLNSTYHNEYYLSSTDVFGSTTFVSVSKFDDDFCGFLCDGYLRSSKTVHFNLTGVELDTPWFSQEDKDILWESSELLSRTAATQALSGWYNTRRGKLHLALANEVLSISASTAALIDGLLSFDPPDPNYTEIAVPVTPTTSKQPILPGEDITQQQADAFNALLSNLQQGIGLARAILTSFDRASGAQQAIDTYWVEQQLQAARIYSGQYADLLETRPQLLENLKQAEKMDPDLSFDLTGEDLAQYLYDLANQGLPADQLQMLTEMDVDARGRTQILSALMLAEFPAGTLEDDTIARYPESLTDPDLIASTQALAAALREFAQGQGWRVNLPFIIR